MKSRGGRAGRIVRRTLADGTVKTYQYGPYRGSPAAEIAADSMGALIAAWQRSPEWRDLSPATQQYYGIYLRSLSSARHVPVADVRRRELLLLRDAIAAERGNGAATAFIRTASALFTWALGHEWIEHSPAARIKALAHGELRPWTRQEAAKALAGLPEHLRRAVVLALYTGQRRGDLCALPWSAFDGRTLRLTQRKTGEPLVIPCHPVLASELHKWREDRGALTILADARGQPWRAGLLSAQLPRALVRLGLPRDLNMHGLRKLAASNLAEAGCSTHEIAAITGHRTLSMVQHYTKAADQERLAGAAIHRLSERPDKRKTEPRKTIG